MKLKVKCLHEGFYNNARIARGEVFYIKDASDFSHLWMKAEGWKPEPPKGIIAEIAESPEHKAKSKKFVPFDSKTHGKKNAAPGEEFEEFDHKAPPPGDEPMEEDEEPKPVVKGPRAQKSVI